MEKERLGDLSVFLAVAEARSFTRAARALATSQSAVSQIVRRLEASLGLRLLSRNTRHVAPTEAGERLLQTLRPALSDIDTQIAALGELRDRPSGTLRITTSRHAAETLLWPRLSRLIEQHPELKVQLSIDHSLTDIVAERFDAGVRLGEQVAKDMVAVRIGPQMRLAVVASPAYLKQHGRPKTPHELTGHRCINIRFTANGANYVWEFEKAGRAVNVRVEGPLVLNDSALVLKAAEEGHGLACLLEDLAAKAVAEGRLVRVLQDWCAPFAGYHLYYPDRRQLPPALKLLIEALRLRTRP